MSEISLERFNEVMDALEKGEVRVAEKVDGVWKVNSWVKEVILAGFRLGTIVEMPDSLTRTPSPCGSSLLRTECASFRAEAR